MSDPHHLHAPAAAMPDGCAVPLGDNKYCGVTPARPRGGNRLPTCRRHRKYHTGHWDARVEEPHCDFCGAVHPTWVFAGLGSTVHGVITGTTLQTPQWWGICGVCKAAVDVADVEQAIRLLLARHREIQAPAIRRELVTVGVEGVRIATEEMVRSWRAVLQGRDRSRPILPWAEWDGSLRP